MIEKIITLSNGKTAKLLVPERSYDRTRLNAMASTLDTGMHDRDDWSGNVTKGGPGSGNHGHIGRPGRRGGSTGRGDSGAWAPVMSKEDAEKYVEGSEYTATLYHGTLVKHKDSIEESGLVPGEMGFYGNGVYFSNSNTISNEYGKLQVEAKVKLENPAVFNSVVEFNNVFDDFAEKNKIGDMDVDAMSKFSNYLSSNHDGVIITNNSFGADIVTVFDPKNIAVYNITNNEN